MKHIIFLIAVLLLYSCQKGELPVPKKVRVEVVDTTSNTAGELQTTQVNMESDYRTQIWFSLAENRIVHSNLKTDWDLCFQTSPDGFHVMLNGSRAMKIFKTNKINLSEVTDTTGLGSNSKADMPSGNLDSTAIGDWQVDNKVYVINRGYNETGQLTGFYKLKITGVTASAYTFEYGDIYGQQVYQGTVAKDDAYNFIGYSFTTHHSVPNIEPPKMNYDLCFTIYTHLFHDPLQYYQVTGVFTNSYRTKTTRITDKPFDNIVLKDTNRVFQSRRDMIGFDWKSFNLGTNLFTVYPELCYIVSDNKGFYYKLHFIGFYNSSGIKGFPKFEFKRL